MERFRVMPRGSGYPMQRAMIWEASPQIICYYLMWIPGAILDGRKGCIAITAARSGTRWIGNGAARA